MGMEGSFVSAWVPQSTNLQGGLNKHACSVVRAQVSLPVQTSKSASAHTNVDVLKGLNTKLRRTLSLDGGGVRGILTATVLVRLEDAIRDEICRRNNVPDRCRWEFPVHLNDYFDCIVGTSTGAILAGYFAARGAHALENILESTSPKNQFDLYRRIRSKRQQSFCHGVEEKEYPDTPIWNTWIKEKAQNKAPANPSFYHAGSAEGALATDIVVAKRIFPEMSRNPIIRIFQTISSVIAGPKYSASGLEDVLREAFADTTLEDLAYTPRTGGRSNSALLMPSYDLELNAASTFYVESRQSVESRAPFGIITVDEVLKARFHESLAHGNEPSNLLKRSELQTRRSGKDGGAQPVSSLSSEDNKASGEMGDQHWKADLVQVHMNVLLRDAIRASSAAPCYLPAKVVKEYTVGRNVKLHNNSNAEMTPTVDSVRRPVEDGDEGMIAPRTMVDGGVVANNPALQAIAFAMHNWSNAEKPLSLSDTSMLSVGTGQVMTSLKDKANASLLGWNVSILNLTMTGSGNALQSMLDFVLHAFHSFKPVQYLRIQKTYVPGDGQIVDAKLEMMDNTSDDMIMHLEEVGDLLAADEREKIVRYVRTMIFDPSLP